MDSPHIVIVDDNDAVRAAVAAVARDALPSAFVTEFVSASGALQEVMGGSVDLLITNCFMPDMDGPTLVRMIRKQSIAVPIIMVSASEEARELGEEAGIDRFITKSAIGSLLPQAMDALIRP